MSYDKELARINGQIKDITDRVAHWRKTGVATAIIEKELKFLERVTQMRVRLLATKHPVHYLDSEMKGLKASIDVILEAESIESSLLSDCVTVVDDDDTVIVDPDTMDLVCESEDANRSMEVSKLLKIQAELRFNLMVATHKITELTETVLQLKRTQQASGQIIEKQAASIKTVVKFVSDTPEIYFPQTQPVQLQEVGFFQPSTGPVFPELKFRVVFPEDKQYPHAQFVLVRAKLNPQYTWKPDELNVLRQELQAIIKAGAHTNNALRLKCPFVSDCISTTRSLVPPQWGEDGPKVFETTVEMKRWEAGVFMLAAGIAIPYFLPSAILVPQRAVKPVIITGAVDKEGPFRDVIGITEPLKTPEPAPKITCNWISQSKLLVHVVVPAIRGRRIVLRIVKASNTQETINNSLGTPLHFRITHDVSSYSRFGFLINNIPEDGPYTEWKLEIYTDEYDAQSLRFFQTKLYGLKPTPYRKDLPPRPTDQPRVVCSLCLTAFSDTSMSFLGPSVTPPYKALDPLGDVVANNFVCFCVFHPACWLEKMKNGKCPCPKCGVNYYVHSSPIMCSIQSAGQTIKA